MMRLRFRIERPKLEGSMRAVSFVYESTSPWVLGLSSNQNVLSLPERWCRCTGIPQLSKYALSQKSWVLKVSVFIWIISVVV